jgi:predicted N-acetyltransferase YhbS
MNVTSGGTWAGTDLIIRPLREEDLSAADTVRRLAFGTFLGLPDPLTFRGDADPIRPRFLTNQAGAFAAELGGEVVGSNVIVDWGSVGFFGPLSVRPDLWDRGIARRLVEAAMAEFDRRRTSHLGLYTFGNSPKHIALYQRYGFWPHYPTVILSKPVGSPVERVAWSAYSELPEAEQRARRDAIRQVTDAVYPGLNLGPEIDAVASYRFGETVLLGDGDVLAGFAVCHHGPKTEAGSHTCYVKFGAVRPEPNAEASLGRLLAACDAMAADQGMSKLVAGVNTARRETYRHLLAAGFRIEVLGVAMNRPDGAAYNRPGVYVLDDWR